MLTYVYECDKCRKTTEIRQRVTAAHLTKCPVCGSKKFRRIISSATVMTTRRSVRRKSLGTVGSFGPEA